MITPLATRLPHVISCKAYFVSGLFNPTVLSVTVPAAERAFNALPRQVGRRKQVNVSVNATNNCLDIDLYTDQPVAAGKELQVAQYFSKELSMQPGMAAYIVHRRLLMQ